MILSIFGSFVYQLSSFNYVTKESDRIPKFVVDIRLLKVPKVEVETGGVTRDLIRSVNG